VEKTAVRSPSRTAFRMGVLGCWASVDMALCAAVESVSRAKALRVGSRRLTFISVDMAYRSNAGGGEYTWAFERYFLTICVREERDKASSGSRLEAGLQAGALHSNLIKTSERDDDLIFWFMGQAGLLFFQEAVDFFY
jgi:hypothetical protein